MRKHISVTNDRVAEILTTSTNASRLIEEAVLHYANALACNDLPESHRLRVAQQGLIKGELM